MKIVIVADIHGNAQNVEKALQWARDNNAGGMIICGDIATPMTVEHISKNFVGQIWVVIGNADCFVCDEVRYLPNIDCVGRYGTRKIEQYLVGMCHEPDFFSNVLKIAECNIVFYGHTHKPWIENKNGVSFINPGTLGGVFNPPTFAYWNTDDGELKLIRV